MQVYKNFAEMFAHLRGKVEVITPKEYVPKEEPKAEAKEAKPKKSRKKKEN